MSAPVKIIITIISLPIFLMLLIIGKGIFLPLTLTMDVKSPEEDMYQVFYNAGREDYNETDSVRIKVDKDSDFVKVRFAIPYKKIRKIRIDPGTGTGTVILRNICLKNFFVKHCWTASDIYRDFKPLHDIKTFAVKDSLFYIESIGTDPYFECLSDFSKYETEITSKGMLILFFVFIISSVILYFMRRKIRRIREGMKTYRGIILFISVLTFEILLYNLFFIPHYSVDCYASIYDQESLAINYSSSARPLPALFVLLMGYLGINLVKKQIFFTALSIFTLSLSVYILTNTVMSLRRDNALFSTIFSALASILVFNNIFFVENFTFSYHLIFQASALLLIAFSVRILAINFSVRTMFGYLLFAILINFIYQGYGGILVPLVSVFLLSHSRGSLKRFFASVFFVCTAYFISLAVNTAYIKYVHPLFSSVSYRRFENLSLAVVMDNMKNLIKAQHDVWVAHFTLLPEYFFVSCCMLSIIVYFLIKKEPAFGPAVTISMLMVVIFSSVFFSFLPHIFSPAFWLAPRTIIGISALPGVIFLASMLLGRLGNGLKFFTGAAILVYITVLFIYTNRIASDQIHTNRMDNEYAKLIMQEIVMKEKESGDTVSKLSFVPDTSPTFCYKDVICWGNLNVSARLKPNVEGCEGAEYWSFPNLLRMNSGRSLEVVPMDNAVYEVFFKNRDWDHFSSEQVVVKNNTAYIVTY